MDNLNIRLQGWLDSYIKPRSKSIHHLQYTYDLISEAADEIERLTVLYKACRSEMAKRDSKILSQEERINELEQQWIPVSERLPENGQDVLTVEDSEIITSTYVDAAFYVDGLLEEYCTHTPLHWMPLPEPPENNDE